MKLVRTLNILWIAALVMSVTLPASAQMSETEREQFEELKRDVDTLKRQVQELRGNNRGSRPSSGDAGSQSAPQSRTVSLGTLPTLGSRDARIAMIEFSDYQCPFCSRFHKQTFGRLKQKYFDTGKVLYAYRDLPSPARPQATKAAIAARCAAEQDRFHDMQKRLFEVGGKLSDSAYATLAKKLGLDENKFEQCMLKEEHIERVERDILEGRQLKVAGTPSFFIGILQGDRIVKAELLVGAMPYTVFKRALEKHLK